MELTEGRKREALQLMQKLDEEKWRIIQNIAAALTADPTPEEKAAEAERRERHRQQLEQRGTMLSASEATLKAWKERNLKGVQIPERYEMMIPAMKPLMDYATRINPDHEAIWNSFDAMYSYGFKRGMAYSKAKAKKKAALHAANGKDGLERSTDET